METKEEKQAHKELDKKIKDCKNCCPISKEERYCEDCHKLVIDFMDKWGAGVLTRDEHFEDMEKYCDAINECNSKQADTIMEQRHKISELKEKITLIIGEKK